jgi:3-phenylpropionate/trans-cinnamate dioxygenase ferredoxin subunit
LKEVGEEEMATVEVAQVNEVPAGTMKSCLVEGKRILISNVEGRFYAINGTCTHAGGDLSKGKLEGKIVTCPRHGSKFDVTTGKCISGPRIGFLKLSAGDEAVFQVIVEENRIKTIVP